MAKVSRVECWTSEQGNKFDNEVDAVLEEQMHKFDLFLSDYPNLKPEIKKGISGFMFNNVQIACAMHDFFHEVVEANGRDLTRKQSSGGGWA